MYTNQRERGMTTLGLLMLVTFVGLFIYGGIRLTPLYLEYISVSKSMASVEKELDGAASEAQIRMALEKRFEIQDVTTLKSSDVILKREGGQWHVRAQYDAEAPFVSNISFLVHFDKSVVLGSGSVP